MSGSYGFRTDDHEPEEGLTVEDAAPAPDFDAMPEFHRAFIACCLEIEASCYDSGNFFTPEAQKEVEEGQADGCLPRDADAWDLSEGCRRNLFNYADAFYRANQKALDAAFTRFPGYGAEQAGYDLLLSSTGHGTGFRDRKALPRALAVWLDERAAYGHSEVSLYAYEDDDAPSGFRIGSGYIHAGFEMLKEEPTCAKE